MWPSLTVKEYDDGLTVNDIASFAYPPGDPRRYKRLERSADGAVVRWV